MPRITVIIFALLFSLNNTYTFSQSWVVKNAPRFRYVNDIVLLPNYKSVAIGGNETNDPITGIFLSADTAKTWELISDVPSKPWLTSASFINELTGFAAGDAGLVKKTVDGGHTWSTISLPAKVAGRNYKSIFFTDLNTGYLIGGRLKSDSIQTILKSTNGGASWDIQLDQPGSWLRASFFLNSQSGFAVGDRGTVFKTVNGGTTWEPIILPEPLSTRQFNSVYFTDQQTGFIVGGKQAKDSIQTILKTINGGTEWTVIKDSPGPMLNDVHFPTPQFGYAVGDYGKILKTSDGGNTWDNLIIPVEINDSRGLKTVFFYNRFYGVAAGQTGKILIYFDREGKIPWIEDLPVKLSAEGTVDLKAILHPNSLLTSVKLEYGKTLSFGNSVSLVQNIGGDSPVAISHQLSNLDPTKLYYGRFECRNDAGTSNSKVFSFYAGYVVPNWNFELWDSLVSYRLVNWQTAGNTKQLELENGKAAIEIRSDSKGPGAIFYGDYTKSGKFIGGIPLTEKPDSLVGSFRYQIADEDTALVILMLKKAGLTIADSIYKITGSSDNGFIPLAFKIDYSLDLVPDSLILGVISTNYLGGKMDSTSVIAIDSIGFTGVTLKIPNYSFDFWSENIHFQPKYWITADHNAIQKESYCTRPSYDKYTGTYALRLTNALSGSNFYNGSFRSSIDFNKPSFSVNMQHRFLNCFVKFFPDGQDTLTINVKMYKAGVPVGFGNSTIVSTITSFTAISVPVLYDTEEIPDSAFVMFMLGSTDKGSYDSYALIDALTFDVISINNRNHVTENKLQIFPNPAKDACSIHCSIPDDSSPLLLVYDLSGRKLYQIECSSISAKNFNFSLAELQDGLYLGKLVNSKTNQVLTGSFRIVVNR